MAVHCSTRARCCDHDAHTSSLEGRGHGGGAFGAWCSVARTHAQGPGAPAATHARAEAGGGPTPRGDVAAPARGELPPHIRVASLRVGGCARSPRPEAQGAVEGWHHLWLARSAGLPFLPLRRPARAARGVWASPCGHIGAKAMGKRVTRQKGQQGAARVLQGALRSRALKTVSCWSSYL